jgi:tetratricopeptide (TPR) repeat protein
MPEALDSYDRTTSIEPRSHVAWFMKGVLLGRMENYKLAIECFDKAIDISPQYAEAWYHKGVFSGIIGDDEEAARCMSKAIEIDPNFNPDAHSPIDNQK